MSDERLEDQVRAALDRRSDERYHFDIEPRDGGYALVRNLEPGPFVSEIGDTVMAWKPTLAELQKQILRDDAAHFTLKERTNDPELRDSAEQARKFEEWAKHFPEHLEPSRADFERTASLNKLQRQQERIPTMDPLGTTNPLGRIEVREQQKLDKEIRDELPLARAEIRRAHELQLEADLRIPAWPTTRQETLSQASPALKDEQGIMSRAYSWAREKFTSQTADTLQENQVQAPRLK